MIDYRLAMRLFTIDMIKNLWVTHNNREMQDLEIVSCVEWIVSDFQNSGELYKIVKPKWDLILL